MKLKNANSYPRLKYLAPKGMRGNHGFMWVIGAPPGYWWDNSTKKWALYDDILDSCSNCAPCKTVKAFKRMLRKNPILLKGKPVLVHREYISDDRKGKMHKLDVEVFNNG